jgi:hypothetical protein
MSANYKFAFVRQVAPAPASAPAARVVHAAPAATAARTPVTNANRFSVNRLIHVKNSGGCRSCG